MTYTVRGSTAELARPAILAATTCLLTGATLTRLAARTLVNVCLGAGLCGILAGCSTVAIPPPYTQDELKAICERRNGRWHDGDPMRSFCEYDSRL